MHAWNIDLLFSMGLQEHHSANKFTRRGDKVILDAFPLLDRTRWLLVIMKIVPCVSGVWARMGRSWLRFSSHFEGLCGKDEMIEIEISERIEKQRRVCKRPDMDARDVLARQ